MLENENEDILTGILRIAQKHPNANVSKLILETHRVPSIRNVVLLLNELVQNVEYATNFDISLQYYLNLYETLIQVQNACSLNEAGMLLESSAKIYDRRVDVVLDLVHAQLSSLRKATNEDAKSTDQDKTMPVSTEKVKRTRKRVVENIKDPCEVEMEARKFRKLATEKRFVDETSEEENMRRSATINKQCRRINSDETDFIHPAACLHSVMPDLDTEGELDTKRNFKLFMHHVEHRYNTLVPDINFRLHFLMKDFIDEEQERTSDDETTTSQDVDNRNWPPLSQAYVEKYVNLENEVLRLEHNLLFPADETPAYFDTQHFASSSDEDSPQLSDNTVNTGNTQDSGYFSCTTNTEDESTLSNRMSLNSTQNTTNHDEIDLSSILSGQNSGIELSGITLTDEFSNTLNDLDANKENIVKLIEGRMEKVLINSYKTLLNHCEYVDLSKVKVSLPNMNGGSVLFTELDAKTHRMLSPKVVAHDILACRPSKENLGGILTDALQEALSVLDFLQLNEDDIRQIQEDALRRSETPQRTTTPPSRLQPITLNIMKFEEKLLRRQTIFKLGADMDLFLQARSLKRPRKSNSEATSSSAHRQLKQFCPENRLQMPSDLDYDSSDDFLGFPDNESNFGDFCGFDEKEEEKNNKFAQNKLNVLERWHENETVTSSEQENTSQSTTHPESSTTGSEPTCPDVESEMQQSQNTTVECDQLDIPADENTITEDDPRNQDYNDISDSINETMKNTVDDELQRIEGAACDKMTNVQEWHNSLRQHLANARERHHFDVFNIGTEIMNGLQQSTERNAKNNVYTFEDVMQDKEESYVSRYFLSSLLLINQNNIEVNVTNKNSEKPAKWSDLKFKLLSKKRHTVSIEDNIGMVVHNKNDNDDDEVYDMPISGMKADKRQNSESQKISTTKTITSSAAAAASITKHKKKNKNMLSSTFNVDVDNNDSFNSLEISGVANSTAISCPIILHSSFEHVKINVDIIKPVKQVYKELQTSDDHDSGFYTASSISNKTIELNSN